MDYATESSTNNTDSQESMFFDADLLSIFDECGCEDPLLTLDPFESSNFVGLPALTSVIPEDEVYEEEVTHFPKSRKSKRIESDYIVDQSLSTITNEKVPTKTSRKKMVPTASTSILSLLTPKQLEQQLEQTKTRLVESMERSLTSRKRLNDQVNFDQHCGLPSKQVFYSQLSNFGRSSILSFVSKERYHKMDLLAEK
eukprot:scaffold505_cov240-Chaetoceros_neogracile.AAC.1